MNLSLKVQPAQLVSRHDHKITTTSTIIAEAFEKRHDDVLRKLQNLDCSEDFHARNFAVMSKMVEVGNGAKRESKYYEITKDGFMFLVMGFTGAKAAAWKEAFINAFNALEAEARPPANLQALAEANLKVAQIENHYQSQMIEQQSEIIHLQRYKISSLENPKNKRRALSEAEIETIRRLHQEGYGAAYIGKQIGRSRSTVTTRLRSLQQEAKHESA